EAIAAVREEAWPQAGNADELHEALMGLACLTTDEARGHPHWNSWLADLAKAGRATRLEGEVVLWLPVERLAAFRALYPQALCTPPLSIPEDHDQLWDPDEARVEILRARLSAFGPLSLAQIAEPLALPAAPCSQALVRLEAQGYVLRGRFSPGATEEQWCERHLLARIHRYTVKRLRREIEPVERADFMRFLFDWQRLSPGTRGEGAAALAAVLEQLEGYQAAAGAWEQELLPARVAGYAGHWLDELCRSGRLVWLRQAGRSQSAAGAVRGTPVMLLPRRQLSLWTALGAGGAAPNPSLRAQRVLDALGRQGALFFDELLSEAHLLRSELENALGELVALGLVNADSFAGLRALLAPASKRGRGARRPRHSALIGGMDDAGRWALLRRPEASPEVPPARRPAIAGESLEHIARVLLRRYGVVCWRLLEREADWLPSWRELLRVYHRLEARGEIRGGRFVNGLSGEQFALPEAVALLREVRRRGPDGSLVALSAADPLNLVGTLLPGHKVPVLAGNRLVYRDGVPVAVTLAGKAELLVELDADTAAQVRQRLTQRPG
ncbi:MAG TPA: ATP-dependent DNA helicase, partial [Pseudomonas sp.]|nr:ATP-dependent DNA helicase [Pseudomonas sp.]